MLPAIWHRHIFLFGLIGLAGGMMFGAASTSIPQIILVCNWLLEKQFQSKWKSLKSNKVFLVLFSVYCIHIVGLLYTHNFPKAFDDLRVKIPLLLFPLILFTTKPISVKELRLLLSLFLLSVFVSSICCFLVFKGYTHKVIIDIRKASIFMSHIRFSLFIAFAIIISCYGIITEKNRIIKVVLIILMSWLSFIMYKLEMASGLTFLCITVILLILLYSMRQFSKPIWIILLILFFVGSGVMMREVFRSLDMYSKSPNLSSNMLLEKTKNDRPYTQDTTFGLAENGVLIAINVNSDELRKQWKIRSAIDFEQKDKRGNILYYTIIRYMASKGFTKDSVGISLLTQQDITNIENGNCNYKYDLNSGLTTKWRELIWEYTMFNRGENPSGHTLTMRVEFWKTAIYIIKHHFFFGVGTGDAQDQFNVAYVDTKSILIPEWRLRSHNQYLAIGVALGSLGLLIFLISLFYPAIVLRKKLHQLYWPFFFIALLSFFTEDTLETQTGVTFFVYFNTLFLWLAYQKKSIDTNDK